MRNKADIANIKTLVDIKMSLSDEAGEKWGIKAINWPKTSNRNVT
jgi:hypothetical protein